MNRLKQIFTAATGYWIHKRGTLPIGADLFYDITQRLQYGNLDIVFDVGANEGQTLKWIKHQQPKARIYSFEPVMSTFNKLKTNANVFSNCVVENIALGEADGEKKIRLFSDYSVLNSLKDELMSRDGTEEVIHIETLDGYCTKHQIEQISLLKIDTEGYELNVLEGAEKMLAEKQIHFIYCEVGFNKINIRNTAFDKLTGYLEEKGYFFYSLYQVDSHDWKNGNHLANALYIEKSIFR